MTDFHLAALDRLSLYDISSSPSRTIPLSLGKAQGVLLYLALQRKPVNRETLVALFWPRMDPLNGANNLRVLLSQLRHQCRNAAGRSFLFINRQQVGVTPGSLTVDVIDYLQGVPPSEQARLPTFKEIAPGLMLSDCDEFNDWLDGMRKDVRQRALLQIDMAIRHMSSSNDSCGLLAALRMKLELLPHDGNSLRQLMLMLSAEGSEAAALNEFERFRWRMLTELSVEPDEASVNLANILRAKGISPTALDSFAIADSAESVLCIYGELAEGVLGQHERALTDLRTIQLDFRRALTRLGGVTESSGVDWAFLGYLPVQRRPTLLVNKVLAALRATHQAAVEMGLSTNWGMHLDKLRWNTIRPDASGTLHRQTRHHCLLAKPGEIVASGSCMKILARQSAPERTLLHRQLNRKRAIRLFGFDCLSQDAL